MFNFPSLFKKDPVPEHRDNFTFSSEFRAQCKKLGVPLAVVYALLRTESMGVAFRSGHPSMLFEPHIFKKIILATPDLEGTLIQISLSDPDLISDSPISKYGTYSKQIDRFARASYYDQATAIRATTFGKFQVLGDNYSMCGFSSPEDFYLANQTESGQELCFLKYLEGKPGVIQAMVDRDWIKVKRLYNGVKSYDRDNDGEDDYVSELVKNYSRGVLRENPRKSLADSRTVTANLFGGAITGGSIVAILLQAMDTVASNPSVVEKWLGYLNFILGDKIGGVVSAGVLFIVFLAPHIRSVYAYLDDNGFVK